MKKREDKRTALRIKADLWDILVKDSDKNDEGNTSRTIRRILNNYYFAKGESNK